MKTYQDVWVKGRLRQAGERNCSERYAAIKSSLSGHSFSVLDMGAYSGYFSFRLAEDFNAQCLAVDDYAGLARLVALNGNKNVRAINRRLSLQEFQKLGEYDVILCLSFLHHVDNWREHLEYIIQNSQCAFIETPHPSEYLPRAKNKNLLSEIYESVHGLHGENIVEVPGYDDNQNRIVRKVS